MVQLEKRKVSPPILIAHRGYSGRYPENTLLAYQAAHQHGARYMELDLQLTVDRVPVLHHDVSLMRMAGVDADIRDTKAKHFKAMKAAYAERFSDEFQENEFTTFKRFCRWLSEHPDVTIFVEIKPESVERFGVPEVVDEVYKRIVKTGVENQCVIISFNDEVLSYTRKISPMRVGWVLPSWKSKYQAIAESLKPDFLFCDVEFLPRSNDDVWQGAWQWALYNLDDVKSATKMIERGFVWLETNQIGLLMSHGEFQQT